MNYAFELAIFENNEIIRGSDRFYEDISVDRFSPKFKSLLPPICTFCGGTGLRGDRT